MPVLLEPAPGRVLHPEDSDWPILPPTLLTLHRTSAADEQSRQIVCRLDGQPLVELLFGHVYTHEIPPGPHVLLVHNTLVWRRVPFEALPGTHTHFTVGNRAGRGYYFLITMVGAAPLFLMVEPGPPRQPVAPGYAVKPRS